MLVFITELQEFLIRYKFLFRYDLQILFYILRVAISDFLNLVLLILLHLDASLNMLCSYLWSVDMVVFPDWLLLNVVSSPASTLIRAPLLLKKLWRQALDSENLLADFHVEN